MGFLTDKTDLISCETCGQVHNRHFDCTKPPFHSMKNPNSTSGKLPPRPVLELVPSQEMPTEIEVRTIRLRLLVGGVQILSETYGGRSRVVTNAEFCEIMDDAIDDVDSNWARFVVFCLIGAIWGILGLCAGLLVS